METIGKCQCGQVSYEIDGVFEGFFLCHCSYCRKDTGSAHAANLFSATARITWISGEALVRTYQIPQTRHSKSWCSHCGSALPREQKEIGRLVVPAGCLEVAIPLAPDAHIFYGSRANWDENLEQVPKFEGLPS